jgi:surface polysaccharide O-acyltransferase-like enzyme
MKKAGQHKKRMVNIEVLRLLAMMMVVSLHYLAKGELLEKLTGPLSAKGHLAWLLESFSIAAVDVYVLISGYFLVETGFRCRRVISLVLQVMFYTCLLPVVLILTGILPVGEITFYNILQCIFPTNMLHYWFVSAYVLMFLFTPVLNAAVHGMKKRQLQTAIVILLIMESLSKTVIPVRLELDNLGYDAYWFMVVYLIAAYIRLYGIPFLEKKGGRAAACYIGACLGMYGLTMLIRGAYLLTGQFENFIESAYGYNHLLTIGAATALFYVFKNRETEEGEQTQAKVAAAGEGEKTQRKDAKVGEAKQVSVEAGAAGGPAGIICRIAPCSFGVYLLHEQVNVRYVWPFWLGADRCGSAFSLLWHWAAAILTVMVIGLAVDHIRSLLFRGAGKLFAGGRLDQGLRKIDDLVNGLTQ